MGLDNIQLSGQTCAILYGRNLIEDQPSNDKADSGEIIEIGCLGANLKQVLFLVDDPVNKFLGDEEMELLTKLVDACKMSMADIALVNFHTHPLGHQQFRERFRPTKVITFGIPNSALDLPFDIPHFQVQSFQGQHYLTAPPLTRFLNNTALKKALWTSLQQLFLQ